MTIKELIANKNITNIHNQKAPPGVFIELKRDKEVVTHFITHFPNGNTNTQVADDRSPILSHPDDNWQEVKDIKDFTAKGKQFVIDNARQRGGANPNLKADLNEVPGQVASNKVVIDTVPGVQGQVIVGGLAKPLAPSVSEDKANIHGIIPKTTFELAKEQDKLATTNSPNPAPVITKPAPIILPPVKSH